MYYNKSHYKELIGYVKEHLEQKEEVVVLCIGTDRCTGDSLGPFVGTFLEESKLKKIIVYGTISEPIHGENIIERMGLINKKHPNSLMIAVDAALLDKENVGKIKIINEGLKPGAGIGKKLPKVGDIAVKGVVNVGGLRAKTSLQNTRLNDVIEMAKEIKAILKKLDIDLKRKETFEGLKILEVVATK